VSRNGCTEQPGDTLVGVLQDGLYMHEKILLTDNTALIIGSQTLTTAGLLENRELSLALDTAIAPALIAAVGSTFDADYAPTAAK
jgi:phosphatidylserine/phosphatidylglycerophosphate/cardiolipin synthase-like enzyme